MSLLSGVVLGSLILHNYDFATTIESLYLLFLSLLSQDWILKTLAFVIMAGAIMALIEKSGGVNGFVEYVLEKKQFVSSKRSALMLSYVLGLIIFVETSITALVSGAVGKPLCDKYKIPHAKLAFVCDSTSAPLGSLIVFNGYGALLLGLIQTQISLGYIDANATDVLINSLFYNFYAMLALVMAFLFIYFSFDIGAMKNATYIEKRNEDKVVLQSSMYYMILPMVLMVLLVFVFLYITGDGNILKGSGSSAIFYTMLTTLIFTFVYYVFTKNMSVGVWFSSAYKGAKSFVAISFLLVFAFGLGDVTGALHTGEYLASLASQGIAPYLLGGFIFILSALISFSTGTSWGTFSIMIPIAVPMAFAMDAQVVLVIGAVVSGGIFGDHCSPISDTTIISSMAADCELVEHVKTQLPYALISGSIAFVLFIIFSII